MTVSDLVALVAAGVENTNATSTTDAGYVTALATLNAKYAAKAAATLVVAA